MEPWARALAYAVGADSDEVAALTGEPSLAAVVGAVGGVDRLVTAADAAQRAGLPWPRPVDRPADLGWAQWSALLVAARHLVGQAQAERSGRVLDGRAPDADELRLLRDVPPHHGG